MENNPHRDSLIERRHCQTEHEDLWDRLTLAQKFSAGSLAKYGYDLAFIRNSASGSLAIMLQDDKSTTIASDGTIDPNPSITIR